MLTERFGWRTLSAPVALSVVLGLASAAGSTEPPTEVERAEPPTGVERPRPNATIRSLGTKDEMSLAGSCGVAAKGGAFCEYASKTERGQIDLLPGERVRVRLAPGVKRLRGDLVKRRRSRTIKQYPGLVEGDPVAGTHGRVWRFEFPELFDANAVFVYVTYRPWARKGEKRIHTATWASRFEAPGQ